MGDSLPVRRGVRNTAQPTASPAAFTVLCSRPDGPDRAAIVLRDIVEAEPCVVRRFAAKMFEGAAHRHGLPLDVQVIDDAGALVFCCTMGGAR